MADPILQNLADYADILPSLGGSDPNSYDDDARIAKAQLPAALTPPQGAPIAEKVVRFLMDYSDDSDHERGVLRDIVWDLVQPYIDAGGTINDALAPLICSPVFSRSDQARFDAVLGSLANGQSKTPPEQPPALVVTTCAALGGSAYGPLMAHNAVEKWLSYAAAHGLPTKQDLLDAYAVLDPAYAATKIAGYIEANFGDDGSCPSDLMEEYRKLNEQGFGVDSPTSATPDYGALQFGFDFEQHTLSGWSYLALTSLQRQQAAKGQVDATMLANLDQADPWAGAYFRWQALQDQVNAGQPLNPDYLASLAGTRPLAATDVCEQALNAQIARHQNLDNETLKTLFTINPAAGIDICNRSFDDALQPTNRLAPLSASGPDPTYSVTNESQPSIRVSFSSMGASRPRVGDLIKLYDDSGTVIGQATVSLTQTMIGYTDVQVGEGLPPGSTYYLPDGSYNIFSQFFHATTPGGPLVPSDLSLPLPVLVDTAPPTISSAHWNSNDIVIKFNTGAAGLANVQPDPRDFTIYRYTSAGNPDVPPTMSVKDVAIDGVNNQLILTAEGNIAATMSLSYTPAYGAPQLQDIAGNPIAINNRSVSWQSGMPVPAAQPNPYAGLPPARVLDMGTWALLNQYLPVVAQQTYGKFRAANLLTSSYPDITNMSLVEAGMVKCLTMSDNLEKGLRSDVAAQNAKNSEMKLDNVVYGDLENVDHQAPSATPSDKTVASILGDKFQSLADAINQDLQAAHQTDLLPSANGMLDSSVTVGQLQGAIVKLKEVIDNLSTQSNTEMFSVQSKMTERNQLLQFVSDMLAKFASLFLEINRNLN